MFILRPSNKVSFASFGFLPTGSVWRDLLCRLAGHPNLLKRLQASDIIAALDIRPTDQVLDLGCGAGYITVEIAKLAAKATGIDVNPFVTTIRIPSALEGRLEYIQTSGTRLPFPAGHFDRVLASEVLPMIPDPAVFLGEIRRVLKPEGKLVIANGTGPVVLQEAYQAKAPRLLRLARRYPGRFPASYEDYCAIFQKIAGTAQKRFLDESEIMAMLKQHGFRTLSAGYSPRARAGSWLAWRQFKLYLRTGKVVSNGSFVIPFILLTLISMFDRRDYKGGLIVVATTRQ